MGTFIAVLTNIFSRLSEPLNEIHKLKILKRNISPFYQTQLGLTEINTIEELVFLGRRLETIRTSVEAFVPPPAKRYTQLLEPDLAYVAAEPLSVAEVTDSMTSSDNNLKCFKCNKTRHIARFCNLNLKCFGCGAPGVIRPRCNQCNKQISPPHQLQ